MSNFDRDYIKRCARRARQELDLSAEHARGAVARLKLINGHLETNAAELAWGTASTKDRDAVCQSIGVQTSEPIDIELLMRKVETHATNIYNHSPAGFDWGYGGSGAAQLALAICLVHLDGNAEMALEVYQDFKWRVISMLDISKDWKLSGRQVREAIEAGRSAKTRAAAELRTEGGAL